MRKRLFEIVEKAHKGDIWSSVYDIFMLVVIMASILPLTVIKQMQFFTYLEIFTTMVFIADYLLRWITADIRQDKKGVVSFILYPFTPMAIIDLLSILPAFGIMNKSFKILRITRLLKILRVLKLLRYTDKISLFINVLHKERKVLFSVLAIAIMYVFITALIIFNVEPRLNPITGQPTFEDFFDAIYWATVTLTTVGYGDICPVTDLGRFVSILSSLFGVAIIALPSGVITASYLDELRHKSDNQEN